MRNAEFEGTDGDVIAINPLNYATVVPVHGNACKVYLNSGVAITIPEPYNVVVAKFNVAMREEGAG